MALSEAKKRANNKYDKNNYDTVLLRIRKDSEFNRARITAIATKAGESLNNYILEAVKQRIEREK